MDDSDRISSDSFENNDDELHGEEVEREEVAGDEDHATSVAGNKRKRAPTKRSSSDMPPKPRKPPAPRAPAWQHFTRQVSDRSKSNCHYCGTEIGCDSKLNGTSSMNSHIASCKMYKAYLERGTQKGLSEDNSGALTTVKHDKDLFRRTTNKMIVLSELPFSFVESEGFRLFCRDLLPMYKPVCRKTATVDIFGMYKQEKLSLKKLFGNDKQRVSLTTDIWVATTTGCSYMVVTAHWIDSNWELQKRIISFKPVIDHKGDTIAENLIECVKEWGIEKVFTVTVDNAKANDKALRLFKEAMMLKGVNALVRDGDYLHMRCCAHILNLIVKDGLAKVKDSIVAIRNAVKYVRSSSARLSSFQLRVETGNISRGSLSLDCLTRWNSTYLMLTAALKLRIAFEKMLHEDKLYNEYFLEPEVNTETGEKVIRLGPPTSSDWDEVHRLVKFLKLFFNCTLVFSASKTVTSSLCYKEIVTIELNLIKLSNKSDEELRKEATLMRDKFEKYWDGLFNMNPLVIIASVLDPRNKMQFASHCFDKLYGKDSMESNHLRASIKSAMSQLYEEYAMILNKQSQGENAPTKSDQGESQEQANLFDLSDDEDYERMDYLYDEMTNETANEEASSELEIYLMEKQVARSKNNLGLDYDLLAWWKRNSFKYPVLSELARDVLAVQVSSVASESAFSTSGRVLDPFRSCLAPHMIESLICLQQWLRNSIQAEALHLNIKQMLEELEFHESLGNPQGTT